MENYVNNVNRMNQLLQEGKLIRGGQITGGGPLQTPGRPNFTMGGGGSTQVPVNPRNIPAVRTPTTPMVRPGGSALQAIATDAELVNNAVKPQLLLEDKFMGPRFQGSMRGGKVYQTLGGRLGGAAKFLGRATPAMTAVSALTPVAEYTAKKAQESGQGIPTQIASQTRATDSWEAPTSTMAISNTNPFTGAPIKKTSNFPMNGAPSDEGYTTSYPIGLVSTPYEEEKKEAPKGDETSKVSALPAIPHYEFDPTQLNMIKGVHQNTLDSTNAKFQQSNDLQKAWGDAIARNIGSGYGDSALGAIMMGKEFGSTVGSRAGTLESQAANESNLAAHAMPAYNHAYDQGDVLPTKEGEANILSALKRREQLTDPMFPYEKALKESMTGYHNAQTSALPVQAQAQMMTALREHANQDPILGMLLKQYQENYTMNPEAAKSAARTIAANYGHMGNHYILPAPKVQ